MNTLNPPCSFRNLLDTWQHDPELLTLAEWETLRDHLMAETLCPLCLARMEENERLVELQKQAATLLVKAQDQPEVGTNAVNFVATNQNKALERTGQDARKSDETTSIRQEPTELGIASEQHVGSMKPLEGLVAFVVNSLGDLLSPYREVATLGRTCTDKDIVKEIAIPDTLQSAAHWLKHRKVEVFQVGAVGARVRYGVRVVPLGRAEIENIDVPLRVTLRGANRNEAVTVLTSRRSAQIFGRPFAADWSTLSISLELCAKDKNAL